MTDLDFTGMNIAEREALTVAELMNPLRNPDYDPAKFTGVHDPDTYRNLELDGIRDREWAVVAVIGYARVRTTDQNYSVRGSANR